MLRILRVILSFAISGLLVIAGWYLYALQSDWPQVSIQNICSGQLKPPRKLTCAGLALQAAGKGRAAIDAYVFAAEPAQGVQPDSYAQYLLALAFKDAIGGLPANNDTAKQWLSKSSSQGNPLAMQITHVGGIPAGWVWYLFFAVVGIVLRYRNVAMAAREPIEVRKTAIEAAYLVSMGATALLFGALAKQSFFVGADFIVDIQLSLVAATCLGAGIVLSLQKRSMRATALRNLIEKSVNDPLTPAERSKVNADIDKLAGGTNGHITFPQKLRIFFLEPELLGIDGVRK